MNRLFKWSLWVFAGCFLAACAGNINVDGDGSLSKYTEAQLSQGTPAIQITDLDVEFGTIHDNSNLTHEYKFKNTGDGILVIKKIVPGCGTWLTFYNKAVPPGGEGKIVAKLNPRGCSQPGKKWILVTTNDPKKAYFSLTMHGTLAD